MLTKASKTFSTDIASVRALKDEADQLIGIAEELEKLSSEIADDALRQKIEGQVKRLLGRTEAIFGSIRKLL